MVDLFGNKKREREYIDLKTKYEGMSRAFDATQSRLNNLNKTFTNSITRPSLTSPYMSTDTGAKLGIYPFPLIIIQEMVKNSDSVRIPIESIIREMFKNGFEIKEKYKYKCHNCSKEFQFKPESDDTLEEGKDTINTFGEQHPGQTQNEKNPNKPFPSKEGGEDKPDFKDDAEEDEGSDGGVIKSLGFTKYFSWMNKIKNSRYIMKDYDDKELVCDDCGAKALRRPDPMHRKVLNKLLTDPINSNMQTLEDLTIQCELDVEITDNLYAIILKTYDIDDYTHEIVGFRIAELLRSDPAQVAMIVDSDGRPGYDDNGNRVYVCPKFEHRNKRLIKPYCDICGTMALRAVCEVNSVYSIGIPQPKRVVYGEGEFIWKAGKYFPGLVYGYSEIYAIWSKITSLQFMDEYIRKYFDKMRPPRGMLIMASRNYEGFKKSWDQLQQKALEDPYEIYPVLVETDRGGKNMAQWIDFTGSLKELEFTEIRTELRRIISAAYGVSSQVYNDVSDVSGGAENLGLTRTNRKIKFDQAWIKRALLDKICRLVGVDDWEIKLKAGEDTDLLREQQVEGVKIANAEAMARMGFEVTRTHAGDFKFSKNPTQGAQPTTETGGGNLSSSKTDPKQEMSTQNEGEVLQKRPSDVGGTNQGSTSAGQGMSSSKKSVKKRKKKTEYTVKHTEEGTKIIKEEKPEDDEE